MTTTRKSFFDVVNKVIIVLALVMFAVAWAKGQETKSDTGKPVSATLDLVPNEIKIPELNLLRIQNLSFRFQLLVTQRTQIEQELREIQVEVFTELSNVRKSLDANSDTWNVDLVKGVFVRKPEPEEKKKE